MSHVLSFDPEQVPVIGTDAHLAPVPIAHLAPEVLRSRFAAPPAWTPDITGDARIPQRPLRDASVLVALVNRPAHMGGPRVLLTRRTEHLRDHAGQIAFPGGRREPDDADVVATALRESREEIGLIPEHVEVIGRLPPYTTGTAYVITPVVALLPPDLPLRPDPAEVAEVFEVPLNHLMDPAQHRRHEVSVQGQRRVFYSMPWDDGSRRYFIWGATAAMLRNFYRFLAGPAP